MLPCPFELERTELGGEAVDDHLHDPGPVVLRLPRALGNFAVVLSEARVSGASECDPLDDEPDTPGRTGCAPYVCSIETYQSKYCREVARHTLWRVVFGCSSTSSMHRTEESDGPPELT